MVNFLHDFDLPLDALAAVRFQQLELLVYFDCDLLIQNLVKADSDDGVGALANSLTDDVIVNVLNVAALGAELILFLLALLPV